MAFGKKYTPEDLQAATDAVVAPLQQKLQLQYDVINQLQSQLAALKTAHEAETAQHAVEIEQCKMWGEGVLKRVDHSLSIAAGWAAHAGGGKKDEYYQPYGYVRRRNESGREVESFQVLFPWPPDLVSRYDAFALADAHGQQNWGDNYVFWSVKQVAKGWQAEYGRVMRQAQNLPISSYPILADEIKHNSNSSDVVYDEPEMDFELPF